MMADEWVCSICGSDFVMGKQNHRTQLSTQLIDVAIRCSNRDCPNYDHQTHKGMGRAIRRVT